MVDARANDATLIVNEVPVLTLRSSSKSQTPAKRAASAAATLSSAKEGEKITVASDKSSARLMLGPRTIITITPAEAKAQQSDMEGLAAAWASKLNDALALPTLTLSESKLQLPPDKPTSVGLTGSRSRKAVITISDKSVAKVQRAQGVLKIVPVGVGKTVVTVTAGPLSKKLEVNVLPYAAKFPMHLSAEVTGIPATADVVESAIQTAILARAAVPEGASVKLGSDAAPKLNSGATYTADLPIKVEAPNHFPASGLVRVTVKNIPVRRDAEKELWYSNDPENILAAGQIYWGELTPNAPVRLLFHHFNKASRPVVIQYVLANPTEQEVSVAMIMGDSDPSENPTLAGYRAGDQFFQAWLQRSGEVIRIPAKSVVPVVLRRIAPLETSSGLAHLTLFGGQGARVQLVGDAVLPEILDPTWRASGYPAWPWRKLRPTAMANYRGGLNGSPRHVYPSPLRTERFEFQVGGNFAFIRVGQLAIPDQEQDKRLLGNFGVQYDIRGTMSNPTDRATDVEVVFEASAGYSGALFVVNGKYVQANLLQAKQTVTLVKTTLAPGETQPVAVQTIPLSGAHYPATITVRPTGIFTSHQSFGDVVASVLSK